jgi:hypothetical protein
LFLVPESKKKKARMARMNTNKKYIATAAPDAVLRRKAALADLRAGGGLQKKSDRKRARVQRRWLY